MYTIKKILCPTDFSIYSKHALQYAVNVAQRHDAEITLLHIDEFDISPLGYFHLHDEEVQQYRDLKTRFLKEQMDVFVKETVPEGWNIKQQILPGRAYKAIVEEAEAENYDLIVIARRGTTNLSDHLIGSTAERVARFARCPVISIRAHDEPGNRDIKNILCPTDYSQSANAALAYAISIAKKYGGKLYIQHISELDDDQKIEEIKSKAPKISEISDEADDLDVEFIYDRDIEPNNSIIRFADDRDIDLIVMSTHGQKGLRRVFIGNNTAEVIRKAECPVLTVTHPVHKVVFSRLVTRGEKQPTETT